MKTKILGFIFLMITSGCGKDVTVPQPLERQTSITLSDSKNISDKGIISKGETTTLLYNEKNYGISDYSSKMALDFIKELPLGESSVQFTGEIRENEIIIKRFD